MAQQFVPLTPALIDEGEFLKNMESDLAMLLRDLAAYRKEHGSDSKKAKATLKIEIVVQIEDPDHGSYSVKTRSKKDLPNRPASTSLAFDCESQDEQLEIFVRTTGSDNSDPAQLKFSNRFGDTIPQDPPAP